MLVHRIDREGHRRVRRRRQHVGFAADLDNVRRMAAARPFGMEGVNRPSLEGLNCIFDKPGFVQRVGMDGDLHIEFFRHIEACR